MGTEGALALVFAYYETKLSPIGYGEKQYLSTREERTEKETRSCSPSPLCSCRALQPSWLNSSPALIRTIQDKLTVTIRA